MFGKLLLTSGLILLGLAFGATARAQEVFRASWSIQDPARGLRQKFAEDIIERANDWLTRTDPDAATARIDEPLRVTIIGDVSPGGGRVHAHLSRLVLGTIPIDTNFSEFLDTATIASLVRRDQYWCDESVVVSNEALSPIAAHSDDDDADSIDIFEQTFRAMRLPKLRLALDESSVQLTRDLRMWAGLGNEEIGLPAFSLGRVRAGIAYNQLKIWGELPAPIGTAGSPLLARGLEPAYGIGVSFEKNNLSGIVSGIGGSVSAATANEVIGSGAATASGEHYILSKSALAYGIVPIRLGIFGGAPLQIRLGLGFTQASVVPVASNGAAAETGAVTGAGINSFPLLLARIEYASLSPEGYQRRNVAAQVFGGSALASWQEQITQGFGLRLTGAAYGVFGARDPFLPAYSITLSPIFSLW